MLPAALLGVACAGVRPPAPAPAPAHATPPALSVPLADPSAVPKPATAPEPPAQADADEERRLRAGTKPGAEKLKACRDALTESGLGAAAVVPLFDGAACVVSGARLSQSFVDVPLGSGGSLTLHLTNVPAEIVPPVAGQRRAAVRVHGPLEFTGSTVLSGLVPSRVIELIPSIVRGGPGCWLSDVHSDGSSVTASAQIGFLDVGEVRAPCNALSTDDSAHARQVPPPKGNRWTARVWSDDPDDHDESDQEFSLRARPDAAPVTLSGVAEFERLAEQSSWVKLSARYSDGSSVTGWAERSKVRPMRPDEDSGEMGSGGLGFLGTPDCADPQMPKNSRRMKVRVPSGTAVSAAPGSTPWATTTRPLEVRALAADDFAWLQLLEIPGITEGSGEPKELRHFYVARSKTAAETRRAE